MIKKITLLWLFACLFAAVPGFAQIVESEVIAVNPYFSKQTLVLSGGREIEKTIIQGPPMPPKGFVRTTAALPEPNITEGVNIISDVPAFTWCFGCSATSAAMIAGYYDRNGYPEMYTGPTNGGVMPLNNDLYWSTWVDGCGETRNQCPLSATRMGVDGRTTRGHVDDYWACYGSSGNDPFVVNDWMEHAHADCTADFMKTSQDVAPNSDGATTFYNFTDGSPLYDSDMESFAVQDKDGGYGFKLFYESRNYTVEETYNQYIYPYYNESSGAWNAQGFTYAQYKAEIDAGRPVMIHVKGHTMIGIGYDDTTSETMYIHDTWGHSAATMVWGGTYYDMQHYAVTIVRLSAPAVPVITVTSPQTGAAWWAGSSRSIAWSYSGDPGVQIKMELFKNGSFNRLIAFQWPTGTNGIGVYSWTIPVDQALGNDYTVTVTSTTNGSCVDSSGIFSITAPPDGVKAMPWLELLLLD